MNLSLFHPEPLANERAWKVEMGDCLDLLRGLPDESIDLVVTDPAYESLEKHRSVGTTTRLAKSWFSIFQNSQFPQLFSELYRVLKPDSHCYVMVDAETMFVAKPIAEAAGFRFWKPIVWDKLTVGLGYHYRARCEFILFFEKGKRNLNSRATADVLEFPEDCDDVLKFRRVAGGRFDDDWRKKRAALGGKAFPTEKPVELLEVLIQQSSQPGDIVLDPFAGSGAAGVAARRNERRFIGFDVSEVAVELARSRLEAV